jgi:acylglycerol lipase
MEHVNRHAHVADKLASEGFEVISFDLRGHGKSEGLKGYTIVLIYRHIENKEVVLEDINSFILLTEKLYPKELSRYIFGYSFGATISTLVTEITKENYFNGMVLIAPALELNLAKYKYWLMVNKYLAQLFPRLRLIPVKGKYAFKSRKDY